MKKNWNKQPEKRRKKRRKMLLWEKRAFLEGASIIIGVDECGRGPIAGPVVAAAVVLKPAILKKFTFPRYIHRVDDSKKLSITQREKAYQELTRKSLFGIGLKDQRFIDKENIYKATLEAMKQAVTNLVKEYCHFNKKKEEDIRKDICVLVDGNCSPDIPYRTVQILKGDSKSLSIAAASIVAKVMRDKIMLRYDKKYPWYGFSKHKGYATRRHFDALQKYGPCPVHRRSFTPVKYTTDFA